MQGVRPSGPPISHKSAPMKGDIRFNNGQYEFYNGSVWRRCFDQTTAARLYNDNPTPQVGDTRIEDGVTYIYNGANWVPWVYKK